MSSDRQWNYVKETPPPHNKMVLVAYDGGEEPSFFLGRYIESGWFVDDSEDNPRPWWRAPDFWIDIPQVPEMVEETD